MEDILKFANGNADAIEEVGTLDSAGVFRYSAAALLDRIDPQPILMTAITAISATLLIGALQGRGFSLTRNGLVVSG